MIDVRGPEAYPILSSGIDWLTCTAKPSEQSLALDTYAMTLLHEHDSKASPVLPSFRLGYKGYKADHLFFGRREQDVMLQVSGELADRVFPVAVPLASNVSRLDVQVTVFTEGDEVHLAQTHFDNLKRAPHGNGRPRSFDLIVNHPQGQTLQVNKRSSENFGRVYDKGVEAKLCAAGMLWRYEVELKGAVARHVSTELARREQWQADATALVHQWYSARGVSPPWVPSSASVFRAEVSAGDRDSVLTWFDSSLSITIANAIRRHGLKAVLCALHLQNRVTPK